MMGAEPIPACLAPYSPHRAWVAWSYTGREARKVPFAPTTGRAASSTDPATWGTLAEALRLAAGWRFQPPRGGIGIVSRAVPALVFLDLDRCTDPATGEPVNDDAARLLEACAGTYAERTPSGAGVRIIGTAEDIAAAISRKGSTPGGLALEIYKGADRYLTVTGARCVGHPDRLADISGEVLDLLGSLRGGGGAVAGQAGGDPREDAELVRRIATGEGYHGELTALAARYIGRGIPAAATADCLKGLMLACPEAARDARWSDRYASIDELVRSAATKYAASAEHRRELARLVGRRRYDGIDPDDVMAEADAEAAARGITADIARRIVRWCTERELARREATDA
ncbi:MAG TPA: hypothetical protein VGN83_20370 [Falsiroseomonas sp.]|jgi:hypothetical protein|nr:hypothetical protein [Falsiroseomonas sp.]